MLVNFSFSVLPRPFTTAMMATEMPVWAAGRRVRAWLGSQLWRQGRFRTATELRDLAERAGLAVKSVR